MKKIILILFVLIIALASKAQETVKINGIIIKEKKGSKVSFSNATNGISNNIKITYQGTEKILGRKKHKFKIQKKLLPNGKEESFTYYMRDGDIINFRNWSYRLIVFKDILLFRAITY
jgi:hypothetical protein